MKGILYNIQVIVIIVERQLILQHKLISARVCIYIHNIYVAIVSHTEECSYRLMLAHM